MLWAVLGFLCLGLSGAWAVLFPSREAVEAGLRGELDSCLAGGDPVVPCLTSGAVSALEAAHNSPILELDNGLTLVKEPDPSGENQPGVNPREARTLMEGVGIYMERRSLHWELDDLFPGLLMTVGPNPRGLLQFHMDPRKTTDERSLSTGRLLLKRTLLPILLGVKLNLAALVPVLFAGIILLIKKVLILSKLSFIFSGLSLLGGSHHHHGGHVLHKPGLGSFHNLADPYIHRDSSLIKEPEFPWTGRDERTIY